MPFIDSSDINWNVFIKNENRDLYHLPEYVELDASLHGGRAVAWVCDFGDNRCLMPLVSRPVQSRPLPGRLVPSSSAYGSSVSGTQNLRDLCSPYGYPGVLSSAPLTPGDARDLLHQFHQEAAQEGFVSSFIRLNPFLNDWQLPGSAEMKQIYYGETVSINLSAYQSANQSTFNQNHRRNIKRLHHQGLQVVVNDFSLMPEFMNAYYQTMFRRGAGNYYFFPEYYFRELKMLAGNHLIFISVLSPTGEYLSGGLFTIFGSVMQYHLGATIDSAVKLSPSKLVIEAAIQLGIASGASILHLGGGLGGNKNDGVFRFKAGFSNDRHAFSCLQFIHNPEVYHQLNMLAGFSKEKAAKNRDQEKPVTHGTTVISVEQTSFFSEQSDISVDQTSHISEQSVISLKKSQPHLEQTDHLKTQPVNFKEQSILASAQPTFKNPDYFPQYRAAHG